MKTNIFSITKKATAAMVAFAMIFQPASCGRSDVSDRLADAPGHGKWVDSDVQGTVKAGDTIRLQDDFAAAANQEIITSVQLSPEQPAWNCAVSTMEFVRARYRELLRDASITGPNADALRNFEELVLNWGERNKLGVEPIRKYVDDIQSISSINEMTDYQASPERNPFNLGLIMPGGIGAQTLHVDKSTLVLKVTEYSLTNKDNYKNYSAGALEAKEMTDGVISYLLERLGYDEHSIKEILKGCYAVEQFLADNDCMGMYSNSEMLNKVQTDRAGLEQYTNGYPIFEILDGRGYSEAESFNVDYMLLSKLGRIYDQDHLQELKSFFTVQMLRYGHSMLDYDTLEKVQEIGLSKTEKDPQIVMPTDDQTFATMLQKCSFMPAMDTLYLEKYYPDDTEIDKIRSFIDGLKQSYRTMLNEEDWLSDETKAAAVEKLDNMVVQLIRPSNTADYSGAVVKGYEEGGSILDAAASASRLTNAHTALMASDPLMDRAFWDIYNATFSTTTVNCFYHPELNSIFIMAGWVAVGDSIFGDDITYEEFLGCVGITVGHEISHGFDSSGSRYDLYGRKYDDDGRETDWMPTEDRSRLDERVTQVGSYFSLARPIPGKRQVEGNHVMNEATADMGGVKAILYFVKDTEGFDYDGFFRGYAALWATQADEKSELEQLENDSHPLSFYRVNITLQQYDEFLETYDIQPGDGMYLDPEKRITVW